MQVRDCLRATGAAFVAVFSCGAPPEIPSVNAALSAYRARGVILLLDEAGDLLATCSQALLATAAAAAADALPPVSCILWGADRALDLRSVPQSIMQQGGSASRAQPSAPAGNVANASLPAEATGGGRGVIGMLPGQDLGSAGLSRHAAIAAVRTAVAGLLGSVPADDAPLMTAGLTSADAVQLVAALGELTGLELPGALSRCDADPLVC